MRRLICVFLMGFVFVCYADVQRSEHHVVVRAAQQGVLPTLLDYIDHAKTLSGRFQQVVFHGQTFEESSGTFQLKRPNLFLWHFQSPDEQWIVGNDKKVYQYDVALEQVIVRRRDEVMGGGMMDFLVGTHRLTDLFSLTERVDGAPDVLRETFHDDYFVQLIPKHKDSDFSQFWLVADRDGMLLAVYFASNTGQETLIRLRDVQRNTAIPDRAFDFNPPKGVDVIGDIR